MPSRQKGLLLAFLSAVLYSLIPILGKGAVAQFHPLFAAFTVTAVAGFFLALIVFWRNEFFKSLSNRRRHWVVLIGFLAALGSTASFFGLSFGRANEAGFFFQFETFFAGILAFLFLKEKLSFYQIVGLLLMFIGGYIFSTGFSLSFRVGSLFFLTAAFVWGINSVVIRRNVREISPLFLAFGRNFFSALFLLPISYGYLAQGFKSLTPFYGAYFIIYGAVVAGILLFAYMSLQYIKTAEATSFQLLVPIIAAVIAFFVFGERLSITDLFGAALILSGLFLIAGIVRK